VMRMSGNIHQSGLSSSVGTSCDGPSHRLAGMVRDDWTGSVRFTLKSTTADTTGIWDIAKTKGDTMIHFIGCVCFALGRFGLY
jgi:hypothetical protein